jgi:hypothetical protein
MWAIVFMRPRKNQNPINWMTVKDDKYNASIKEMKEKGLFK